MGFFNSTLVNNLVDEGKLPEVPVNVKVSPSSYTVTSIFGIVVFIILLIFVLSYLKKM